MGTLCVSSLMVTAHERDPPPLTKPKLNWAVTFFFCSTQSAQFGFVFVRRWTRLWSLRRRLSLAAFDAVINAQKVQSATLFLTSITRLWSICLLCVDSVEQ